jgi:hypothetical protein
MVQVVECLPSKFKALSSMPSVTKKKKRIWTLTLPHIHKNYSEM